MYRYVHPLLDVDTRLSIYTLVLDGDIVPQLSCLFFSVTITKIERIKNEVMLQ